MGKYDLNLVTVCTALCIIFKILMSIVIDFKFGARVCYRTGEGGVSFFFFGGGLCFIY